jgi:phosphomannomutase
MTDMSKTIVLFDVDGTLTQPRGLITPEMQDYMTRLGSAVTVGIVGGSDLPKQMEQLGDDVLSRYPYNFSQNGLVAYKDGALTKCTTISDHLGEDNVKRIANWVLRYVADLDIPIKRGTFFEFRTGMFNVSPIGRNCSREERNAYEEFDLKHGVRKTMVAAMAEEFKDLDLTFSIGGQISFDVFPRGWDKTYCLQYIEKDFDTIHFFGDKTFEGGNDFEIFSDDRTQGHTVTSWEDTMKQCKELFGVV